ncbi:MAG: hypothetical protein J0I84_00220 [Terrimonas sp.]|nr:hypothetical protein [Terrimonas sp.]
MYKQFYLDIEGDTEDSYYIKHIQYNIQKKLDKIKYYKYRRIDIEFVFNKSNIDIEWNDQKTAQIKCGIAERILSAIEQYETIQEIYTLVYECLKLLWLSNSWEEGDLSKIFSEIKQEKYISSIIYNKAISSSDKKLKTRFHCKIFPAYADYNIQFLNKKNEVIKEECFLKGQPNLLIFFLFFRNYYWVDNSNFILSDLNKEIFFVFSLNEKFFLEYKPQYNSLETCRNYVKAFEFDKNRIERLKLLNLI